MTGPEHRKMPEKRRSIDELTNEFIAAAAATMNGGAFHQASPPPTRAGRRLKSYVVNRHGERVPPRFDEITRRVEELCTDARYGPPLFDDSVGDYAPAVTKEIVARFRNGMTTREIDYLMVQVCTSNGVEDDDWLRLATRICVSDLHKRSPESMREVYSALCDAAPKRIGEQLSPELLAIIARFSDEIDARLDFSRDYAFRYFGFQTLARSYLLRSRKNVEDSTLLDDQLMERPAHLYMRVALALFCCHPDHRGHEAPEDEARARLERALNYYDLLSTHKISHATPTVLNAGRKRAQYSSCFTAATGDDMAALGDTIKHAMLISKESGGLSVSGHSVRCAGADIHGTGGVSQGIWRWLRILDDTQEMADQGGNRKGAFAFYLEPWYGDILTVLPMARKKGILPSKNAPNIKYGLWMPSAFVRAIEADGDWWLMCPSKAPGLHRVHGAAFDALYSRYVAAGLGKKIKARELLGMIHENLAQVGGPYLLHKDHANHKSNLQNYATINESNLCVEILLPSFSDFEAEEFGEPAGEGQYGVCNLGALCLESFVVTAADVAVSGSGFAQQIGNPCVDFEGLTAASGLLAEALDNVIDLTYYPTPQCERGNKMHRPIGIGIMGLADVFARLGLTYGAPETLALDRALAAAVYYGALEASTRLGRNADGTPNPYPSFWRNGGCPASKGLLQPDLWLKHGHITADWEDAVERASGGFLTPAKWTEMRNRCMRGELRNCYLTAFMPTATTSNIVGQNECFEPYTSLIYMRRTLAGEFVIICRHLVRALKARGLWSAAVRRAIIAAGGSIRDVPGIPDDIKRRFRTAREMDQRVLMHHEAARGAFVSQSQSANRYYEGAPTLKDIATLIVTTHELGLPTASYYVHSTPAAGGVRSALHVVVPTVAPEDVEEVDDEELSPSFPTQQKNELFSMIDAVASDTIGGPGRFCYAESSCSREGGMCAV